MGAGAAAAAGAGGSFPASPSSGTTDCGGGSSAADCQPKDEAAKLKDGNTGDKRATWTVGKGGRSVELDAESWSSSDWLDHHSDRANSWGANQIRNADNPNPNAWDFVFEKPDAMGRGINGSAQGLPLQTHTDVRILDVQKSFSGSGGLGKFVIMEDVNTGQRVGVFHMDTVGNFNKGDVVPGGTFMGAQGSAGNTQFAYPAHVHAVGTKEALEPWVRSQGTGAYTTGSP